MASTDGSEAQSVPAQCVQHVLTKHELQTVEGPVERTLTGMLASADDGPAQGMTGFGQPFRKRLLSETQIAHGLVQNIFMSGTRLWEKKNLLWILGLLGSHLNQMSSFVTFRERMRGSSRINWTCQLHYEL